jgi:plastocyanin
MRLIIWALLSGFVVATGGFGLNLATSEGGGGGCHGPLTDGAATHIEIANHCFGPVVARVQPGDTVLWTNRDQALHNVYSPGQTWGDGKDLTQGASVKTVFPATGIFPYVCTLHPMMTGVVVVGDGSASAAAYTPLTSGQIAALAGPDPALRGETRVAPANAATVAPPEGDGGRTLAIAGLAAVASLTGLGAIGVALVRRR